MPFMGRRSSRSGNGDGRSGSGSGRQRGDRDYDDYEYGYQQQDDDSWSPDEYFTPGGIRDRRASNGPDGSYEADGGYDPASTGGFEAPPADGQGSRRGRWPGRAARGEQRGEGEGERTRRVRLRRERDVGIWPDDEVSDEDYWASVATDKPIPRTGQDQDRGVPGLADQGRGQAAFQPPSRVGNSGSRQAAWQGSGDRTEVISRVNRRDGGDRNDRPAEPAMRQPPPYAPQADARAPYRPGIPGHQPPSSPRGASGRDAAPQDDPLTSNAYSRDALAATDGRSYQAASARRAQAPVPDRSPVQGQQRPAQPSFRPAEPAPHRGPRGQQAPVAAIGSGDPYAHQPPPARPSAQGRSPDLYTRPASGAPGSRGRHAAGPGSPGFTPAAGGQGASGPGYPGPGYPGPGASGYAPGAQSPGGYASPGGYVSSASARNGHGTGYLGGSGYLPEAAPGYAPGGYRAAAGSPASPYPANGGNVSGYGPGGYAAGGYGDAVQPVARGQRWDGYGTSRDGGYGDPRQGGTRY